MFPRLVFLAVFLACSVQSAPRQPYYYGQAGPRQGYGGANSLEQPSVPKEIKPNFYERAVFRQPLSDRMVEPGRSTTFICKVRDMAGNSLVWEKDGRVLFVDNYRVTWSGKLHAAKRRGEYLLRVFHVSKEEEGNYTCVVNSDPPQRSTGQLKVDGFLCPRRRSGMFPDPKDCSRYYMCTAGGVKGERGYCPAGLVFDAGRKVCDKPAIVPRPCGLSYHGEKTGPKSGWYL
ncbi:PREDICTED: uncharacterized protein LOC109468083 [Branchiostoma belcheri]|uniref:chitinase n=1 Tax=Branchiostoma belcheri TaxID=7741 RepID=A0A6P4YX95_BRABE|nr:PREDICTED: uncharacterized protein LOC109468083 [Branchiostoma belcheri]